MTLAKYKSSCLGMETLLNAPLHTSQQRDKVSCCNVVFFFFNSHQMVELLCSD